MHKKKSTPMKRYILYRQFKVEAVKLAYSGDMSVT